MIVWCVQLRIICSLGFTTSASGWIVHEEVAKNCMFLLLVTITHWNDKFWNVYVHVEVTLYVKSTWSIPGGWEEHDI